MSPELAVFLAVAALVVGTFWPQLWCPRIAHWRAGVGSSNGLWLPAWRSRFSLRNEVGEVERFGPLPREYRTTFGWCARCGDRARLDGKR